MVGKRAREPDGDHGGVVEDGNVDKMDGDSSDDDVRETCREG